MRYIALFALIFILTPHFTHAQTDVVSGQRYGRLVIRNAIVVNGNGTPARGAVRHCAGEQSHCGPCPARSGGD